MILSVPSEQPLAFHAGVAQLTAHTASTLTASSSNPVSRNAHDRTRSMRHKLLSSLGAGGGLVTRRVWVQSTKIAKIMSVPTMQSDMTAAIVDIDTLSLEAS